MNFHIRAMQTEDLPRVAEIDSLSMSNPWSERMFATELSNPHARTSVAEVNGTIVALLVLWMILDEAHIATIAVHPDFRRQGISKIMMKTALSAAEKEGALTSLLEVRAGNLAAIKLYEIFGFEEVGLRRGYYKDNGEDALLMTLKDLRAALALKQSL